MFGVRELEGDPVTGDTRDGGDNERLRARERDYADGRVQGNENDQTPAKTRRQGDEPRRAGGEGSGHADADDGLELDEDEQAAAAAIAERRAAKGEVAEDDAGDETTKYEVMVDGQPVEVSLKEALAGYVRQDTFHRRSQELATQRAVLEEDAGRQQTNWAILTKAKADYEEDLKGLIPTEPDWDKAFAIDPAGANEQRKIFQAIYGKLAQSQTERAQMAAHAKREADRRLEKYAVDGFAKFVMEAKIPDEATLNKELNSMRKTAFALGFTEQEVGTVYDPKMLHVLRKASKYDRMMAAAKPKAVVPGKGKTLTPGAATPFGNGPRKSIDEAQRRLASSGRLDDAAEVFRRML